MNKQNVTLAGVVVAVLLAVWGLFTGDTVQNITQNPPIGAVSTLDGVDVPYVSIDNVKTAYRSVPMTATSSTICSIANPYNSTSTVLSLSANITSGILGANNISVSTSTNTYATSTQFFVLDRTIASQSVDSFGWIQANATTSNTRLIPMAANGEVNAIVKANERVNFRISTTTAAGALAAYYGGKCSVIFQQL